MTDIFLHCPFYVITYKRCFALNSVRSFLKELRGMTCSELFIILHYYLNSSTNWSLFVTALNSFNNVSIVWNLLLETVLTILQQKVKNHESTILQNPILSPKDNTWSTPSQIATHHIANLEPQQNHTIASNPAVS